MLTFKEYKEYLSEEVNQHSTHIEDLIITKGKLGVNKALGGLLFLKKQFGKVSTHEYPAVTVKIDGAPAIICGWLNDYFFVASKSIFNKTPKINFTDADIDNNHTGGLAEKLHLALKYLKPVIPKGKIYQGDFLFDKNSRKLQNIDGIKSFVFQPNTIEYSVDADSELGKKIGAAKFGIIFHTEYAVSNGDLATLRLKGFGVREKDLNKTPDVWFMDAFHHNLGTIPSFDTREENKFKELERDIRKNINKVDWNFDADTARHLLTFINSYIRNNTAQPTPERKAADFKLWISDKMTRAIEEKKSVKGKETEKAKWASSVDYAENQKSLNALFSIHNDLTAMKEALIAKLDSVKRLKTFLVKNDGSLVVTGNEGFVLTKTAASGCKLVNRYNFSLANFSSDFHKGWVK